MNRPQRPISPKQKRRDLVQTIAGVVIGLMTPAFATAVLLEFYPQITDLSEIENSTFIFLTMRVLMFSVIINAGLFFGGLRLKKDGLSRGILLASMILVAVVIYYKFQE